MIERREDEGLGSAVAGSLGGSHIVAREVRELPSFGGRGSLGPRMRTTTSRMRSGGMPARIMFAARVARNVMLGSTSFTRNTSVVPGAVPAAYRAAVVSRETSSSDMNGSCRVHAMSAPASIAPMSPPVTASASVRRPPSARQSRTSPSAARIGTT